MIVLPVIRPTLEHIFNSRIKLLAVFTMEIFGELLAGKI